MTSTNRLGLALLLAFLLLGCSKGHKPFARDDAATQAAPRPELPRRYLTHDVKVSGAEMQSTYSGFLDDGRVFVATQDADEGTCLIVTPEEAEEAAREREEVRSMGKDTSVYPTGTVEPIFLVGYDDGHGGITWELTQHTRPGDMNYDGPTTNRAAVEVSCGVEVVFH